MTLPRFMRARRTIVGKSEKPSACQSRRRRCRRIASGRSRVEIEVEAELRERLQRERQHDPIFTDAAAVIAHDRAERRDPAREIAVNGVALLLEATGVRFVLLLQTGAPVVIDSVVAADSEEAA